MIRFIILFAALSLAPLLSVAQTDLHLEGRYQPDTYTKYNIELSEEKINISVFKVNRDEPHLNPLYFDVYFQCDDNKSYYKIKRDFGVFESEQTYCGNDKPLIQKIEDKMYLSLPLKLAEPESGCPSKINRKEVFSIKQIKDYCAQSAVVKN